MVNSGNRSDENINLLVKGVRESYSFSKGIYENVVTCDRDAKKIIIGQFA